MSRNKTVLILIIVVLIGMFSVWTVSAKSGALTNWGLAARPLSSSGSSAPAPLGALNPTTPPTSTFSYTLQDLYNRLGTGAAGAQSTFTEPASGPISGTMHTLNDIMALAPMMDNTAGATRAHVLAYKTFWGLTNGQWGPLSGNMPDNGTVTIVPGTANQTIPAGYHNGAGHVEGDPDLLPRNVKNGVILFGVTGTFTGGVPYPAPIPKTGQTNSYATGDDGDWQMGAVWPIPHFTDNGNGSVTDNLTGLIWLKNANCFGKKVWAQAVADANALNSGECGLSDGSIQGDWRLPNVRELFSLIDFSRYNPALPIGYPFTSVLSDYYWTSTTYAPTDTSAWVVRILNGYVTFGGKSGVYYVWPVRGGQP